MERSFTDIQYNQFLDGPAGVHLETGVLYLNPMLYSQLGDVGRKVVLLHELGHLNVGENEFAADNFAYWKGLGLGIEALEQFQAFIGALKPQSTEQLQRAEAMLTNVIQNELNAGTDASPLYNWLLTTDTHNFFGDKLQSARDFVAKTVGTAYTAIYDTVQSVKQNKQYQQQLEQQKQDAFRQISETEQKAFEELAKKEKQAKEEIEQQKKQQQRYIIGGIILVVVVVAIVFTFKK